VVAGWSSCSFWSHGACLDQGWMLWRGAEVGFEPRFSGGRDSLVEECETVAMSNQGVMSGYVIAVWCKGELVGLL